MCRLFVFAKADNNHPNPDLDWTKFKRGDVIDILEDGVHGGDEAEKSDLFRIIELPGVPVKDMQALIMGDPVQDGDTTHPRLRANRLDLDTIEARAENSKDLLVTKEKPIESLKDIYSIIATKDIVLEIRSTVKKQPKSITIKA